YAGGDVVGDPGGDGVERRARGEHFGDPRLFQGLDVLFGDDAAAEDDDVGSAAGGQLLDHLGEEGHVRPGERRQPDGVDVFLHGGLGDLGGGLMEARVDHLV